MRRYVHIAALLLALCLLLTSCIPKQRTGDEQGDIAMPEPSQEPENMILGEKLPSRLSNVSLYYAMSDGATFSQVSMGIRADAGESLPEAAVNALLSPSSGEEMYFSTGDTKLLSCEYACGIATVDLSIDARNVQSEQEELALLTAIGNTLIGIDGVVGVNVLVGGQSESFGQLPMGVQTEVVPSVTASYAQLLAERDHLQSDSPMPVSRTATLYFPTAEGSYLVPELREVVFNSDDFAGTLIEALKVGPRTESCAVASIPAGVELLDPRPRVQTLSTGEHVLSLNFSSTLANYLVFSGLDVWELAGSLALTACSFLPEIDAVRILVDGDPITACQIGDTVLRFDDGLIRRNDFSGRVGSVATLCLAAADGTLQPVKRAVSTRSALSPRSLLNELFFYTDRAGDGLSFPAPENVFADDILGIQVSGQVARVNLSANLYRCCQSLDALAERNLVYCMVNTLCALDSIRAVRFYVEGLAAETLAGSIYLKSNLMPNPGIVVTPEVTGEP
ncbi:MAG: GerMN domain-containing protein [Clostridia bacterium]|nr:GerMN domain-containing protein [Clostridia bacterium]